MIKMMTYPSEAGRVRFPQSIFGVGFFTMIGPQTVQLCNALWSIADRLHGAMDADDLRECTMTFLFRCRLPEGARIVGKGVPVA